MVPCDAGYGQHPKARAGEHYPACEGGLRVAFHEHGWRKRSLAGT